MKVFFKSLRPCLLVLCIFAPAVAYAGLLPDGYKRLEYIQSSGNQCIDTGYVVGENDTIEVDYELVSNSATGDKMIIAEKTTGNNGLWVETYGTSNQWYVRFGSASSVNTAHKSSYNKGTFTLKRGDFKINGIRVLTPSYAGMPNNTLTIFCRLTSTNAVQYPAYAKISNVKIYGANNNVIHNYIPVKNNSGFIGMYDTVSRQPLVNKTNTAFIAGPEVGIKIATKAYNDAEFEPVQTALTNARTTVSSVVSNTISQSSSIGTLSTSKQNRPTTNCPDYRQCMLVQDANNQPTWFPIVDPFYDLFRPMNMQNWTLSHNGSKVDMGYTQLDYIQSNGTQYIVLPTFANASNINITTNVLHTDGTNEQILLAPSSGIQYLYTVSTWRTWKSGVNSVSLGAIDKSHVFLIKTTSSGVEYYVDGVKNAGVPANLYTSSAFANKTLNLGSRTLASGGDYFWKGKIYSFKADCNGSICINLIPVQRKSDNAIGMYDTVSGAFFGNSGTGNFTYGATVANTDVPADPVWTVVISGNEEGNTTHVTGTVYGTAKCNSLSATANDVATAANLQSSSWTTAGNNCWCALTQVDTNGNAGIHEKPTWVFNATDSTCSSQCATLCRTSFIGDTTGAFRGALSGIQ